MAALMYNNILNSRSHSFHQHAEESKSLKMLFHIVPSRGLLWKPLVLAPFLWFWKFANFVDCLGFLHVPNRVSILYFTLYSQIKWGLWLIHLIWPVALEKFVQSHCCRVQCFTLFLSKAWMGTFQTKPFLACFRIFEEEHVTPLQTATFSESTITKDLTKIPPESYL